MKKEAEKALSIVQEAQEFFQIETMEAVRDEFETICKALQILAGKDPEFIVVRRELSRNAAAEVENAFPNISSNCWLYFWQRIYRAMITAGESHE